MNISKLAAPLALVLAMASTAAGQIIYTENFPHPGTPADNIALSTAGWVNDITGGAAQANRIYADQGGRVYAFANPAGSEAFYTTTALDIGATGDAFPTVDPMAYPFGVSFLVDIAPGFNGQNVRSRIAVQINGGSWYTTVAPINAPIAADQPFATYSVPFNPAAAGWNNLTLTGTGSVAAAGTPATVTIGGPAAANLTGNITGAGLVMTYTAAGTHNFDNFRITPADRPGDVNLDTFVTLADLLIIRTNFRQPAANRMLGDLTNDGFVNFNDYRQWKNNYIPAAGENVDLVPEPTATALGVLAAASLGWVRRRARCAATAA